MVNSLVVLGPYNACAFFCWEIHTIFIKLFSRVVGIEDFILK